MNWLFGILEDDFDAKVLSPDPPSFLLVGVVQLVTLHQLSVVPGGKGSSKNKTAKNALNSHFGHGNFGGSSRGLFVLRVYQCYLWGIWCVFVCSLVFWGPCLE